MFLQDVGVAFVEPKLRGLLLSTVSEHCPDRHASNLGGGRGTLAHGGGSTGPAKLGWLEISTLLMPTSREEPCPRR